MTVLGAPLFNATATVYTADPTTHKYTVPVKSGLACRLAALPLGSNLSPAERAEALATRKLSWEVAYAMPPFAEVEVDGARWRVQGQPVLYVPELPCYYFAMAVKRVP